MIDFQEVSILKVESASWTLPLLYFKQSGLFIVHERVLLEPFRPVQEVSIIWACIPFYLYIVLTMRFRMVPDIDWYLVPRFILDILAKSGSCANANAVLLACPCFAFPMMPCISPSHELSQGVISTGAEYLCAYHPSLVVAPPSYDGIEFADDLLLRSVS